MSTLFEYHNTGDNDQVTAYTAKWRAQTFTPSAAHKITSVKLKLSKGGSPGTVTVGIRATDGSGHPTGSDLCFGTINGNTLSEFPTHTWYEITLGDGCDLSADIKYAIVLRAPAGDSSNFIRWRCEYSSPTYGGGNYEYSDDSGSTWTTVTNIDNMFEDWGDAIVVAPTPVADGRIIGTAIIRKR